MAFAASLQAVESFSLFFADAAAGLASRAKGKRLLHVMASVSMVSDPRNDFDQAWIAASHAGLLLQGDVALQLGQYFLLERVRCAGARAGNHQKEELTRRNRKRRRAESIVPTG